MLNAARWIISLPAALLVTWVVQYLLYGVGSYFVNESWIAKSFTAPFMAAAFILVFWRIAPTFKSIPVRVALGFVSAWAAALIIDSFSRGFSVDKFAIGVCGLSGGILTYLLVQHKHKHKHKNETR